MRVLLVHQNFPGQFKHLAPALVARGDDVTAMAFNRGPQIPGVRIQLSSSPFGSGATHPWAIDIESKLIRGEASLRTAQLLAGQGYRPDVIVGHPAWGEMLFLKDVWPDARLGVFCELYYRAENADHDFDPEFPTTENLVEARARSRMKNLPQRLMFDLADAGISPTHFQADTYPAEMRDRITVVHDGIDTAAVGPGESPVFSIDGVSTDGDVELITFVSRHLEPYRGLHILLRALPDLLRRRPKARIVIVGSDGPGYGSKCPQGTWRHHFLREVAGGLDLSRVHFVGELKYPVFLNLLRVSRLHIYLTYPFVLSWSLLEAMSTACPILASDVEPVREFVEHEKNGLLFDFFDAGALVESAIRLLEDRALAIKLGKQARAKVVATADLKTICLPRQLAWVDSLAATTPRSGIPPL